MSADGIVRGDARFKGARAVELENDALRVVVLPELGAKIASIVHKPTGREVLVQSPGPAARRPAFGGVFDAEAGWGADEMFPAIDAGFFPDEPWRGSPVPDHGEIWSLPWEERLSRSGVEHVVHGVRFPYRFARACSLDGDTLRLDYRVENLSPFVFRSSWAFHPLFATTPASSIELPAGVESVVSASVTPPLDRYGGRYEFPLLRDGGPDLRRVPPSGERSSWKWWVGSRLREGWCALSNPGLGYEVRLAFPADRVPYLGVWVNNGGWNGLECCALEPATGGMDGLEAAGRFGMAHWMAGRAVEEWFLRVRIA